MKTQYFTATSLDGFIATEDDSLDWLFPLGSVYDTSYPAFIAEVGALAMGSSTYEWMLRHATLVAKETGSPWPYTQPSWVFSNRSLPGLPGADIRFVRGTCGRSTRRWCGPHRAGTCGSSAEVISPGSFTTPACWTKSWSRSVRSRWSGASRCFRGA